MMTVRVAFLVVVIAVALVCWYRINAASQQALAQVKADAELVQGTRLLRAQDRFHQTELALAADDCAVHQQAYRDALYELNAVRTLVRG